MPDINFPDFVESTLDSEQVKNLTVPATKSIGQAFGDIFDLCFGGLHEYVEKKRLIHAKNIEDFKKELTTSVSEIPPENLAEPKPSIVGPALEASKYYYEEKEIRDMFKRLIVNSMDNRKAGSVHPSFTEIIKQLSPLDAQNLKLFDKRQSYPICEYHIISDGNKGYRTLLTNVFLDNPNCTKEYEQSVSFSSLNRLELVNVDFMTYMTDAALYEKFEKSEYYQALIRQLSYTVDKKRIEIKRGQVSVTPLGSAFLRVCLTPLPNELTP